MPHKLKTDAIIYPESQYQRHLMESCMRDQYHQQSLHNNSIQVS